MTRRVLISFAVGIAAFVLAPAASASITPALTLDQSAGTGAASTVNLGMDLKFAPNGSDSPKDLTITLPPGLLSNASIDGGACLHAQSPNPACKVGGGTVTATLGGVATTGDVSFFLVAPPKPGDLAGLAQQVTIDGQTSQLGSPGEITVRPLSDPAGFGVNIAFANIPDTYSAGGVLTVPISVQELKTTLNGVRMPASCPATPANLAVTADSYSDPTSKTATAPLHVTGCSALPFTPSLSARAVKDAADFGVQITTDVTQPASPAQATPKSVALSLDPKVLVANAPAVLNDHLLCANPASGTCKAVGTATTTSPLYPVALTGADYLTGTITAPSLTIVFPPPFALTLVGSVATNNTTTFSGLPDIPLTDLRVTLSGGKDSAFLTGCDPASGIASATLIAAAGQGASTSTPFTVAGCPPAPGSTGPGASPGGRAGIVSAAVSGLAGGTPHLSFTLTAGKNAKLKSFTVKLPRGLSFRGRRVHHRLTLTGVSLKGAKIKSIALRHGALVITLRKAVNTVSVKLGPKSLNESAALKRAAKHHRLKRMQLTVVLKNTAGKSTTSRLRLKT